MCKFCVLHGKGKKWFNHVDNFEKHHLDDDQRMELSRSLYLDVSDASIPVTPFMAWYQTMLRGVPLLLKTPVVKHAILPTANRLVEQYHVGQVLTLEEARSVVDISGHVALFDCWCRYKKGTGEACCMGVGAFGDLAEDIPELDYISITTGEALDIMEKYEDKGCFHSVWTVKPPFISTICNCDNRVCHGSEGLRLGVSSALHKGHRIAVTQAEKCNGCGLCLSACHFGARYEHDVVAAADKILCFGCGLCRKRCPQGAIVMDVRK